MIVPHMCSDLVLPPEESIAEGTFKLWRSMLNLIVSLHSIFGCKTLHANFATESFDSLHWWWRVPCCWWSLWRLIVIVVVNSANVPIKNVVASHGDSILVVMLKTSQPLLLYQKLQLVSQEVKYYRGVKYYTGSTKLHGILNITSFSIALVTLKCQKLKIHICNKKKLFCIFFKVFFQF